MAPFFAVKREPEERTVLKVKELRDGNHVLTHNGFSVPIEVDGDRIVIDVGDAVGNLRKGVITGMGDDWTFEDRGDITSVTLKIIEKEGEILLIHSDPERNIPAFSVEKKPRAPERGEG